MYGGIPSDYGSRQRQEAKGRSLGRALLKACNAILPPREQHEIEKAALFAESGRLQAAARCRRKAGY